MLARANATWLLNTLHLRQRTPDLGIPIRGDSHDYVGIKSIRPYERLMEDDIRRVMKMMLATTSS